MKAKGCVRVLIGGLLVWAAIAKIATPSIFFGALLGYELPAPEIALRLLAVTLPWFELICGLALLANFWPETIRPLTVLLCVGFVVALTQALIRGLAIDCGCFGGSRSHWFNTPEFALARAALLCLGSLYLWIASDEN